MCHEVMFWICGKVSLCLLTVVIISLVALLIQSPCENRTAMCHEVMFWICGKVSHCLLTVVISPVVLLMQSPCENSTAMCHEVIFCICGQVSHRLLTVAIISLFILLMQPPCENRTPICLTGDKSRGQLKQQFHQLPLTGTPSFTPADTNKAIRLAKSSTAIGPDGMSTLHLRKLAQGAINYLTNIFNLLISTGQIPEIWHKAIIIPILKPGKDNNIGKNWHPISLLCPATKTLEKLLLPKILTHIPFHPAQHGFRLKHSTCTALSMITAHIAAGFSRKKSAHRTVLVTLDLTAAFDNVDYHQLLECVFNTNLPAIVRRWLYSYMQNR